MSGELLIGFAVGVVWMLGFIGTAMLLSEKEFGAHHEHLAVIMCCLWPVGLPVAWFIR